MRTRSLPNYIGATSGLSVTAGASSATLLNHYSLLGTTEQLLGPPVLGQAASAPTMTAAFNLSSRRAIARRPRTSAGWLHE